MVSKILQKREAIQSIAKTLQVTPDHDESGHFYKFGEPRYPSVTGMIQILKDSALLNWRMNRALEYIQNNFHRITPENLALEVDYAKIAPTFEMNNAGSIGNRVHNWREEVIQLTFDTRSTYPPPELLALPNDEPAVVSGCRGIVKFFKEHKYIPLACELPVADHDLKIGGTIDDIGYVDGELALVDLKTSNSGDKESYYAQVALYLYMFRKLYRLRPKKLYILHVSKDFGDYNLIEIPDVEWTIKWAKKVVEVSWGLETIKQSKKKKYSTI